MSRGCLVTGGAGFIGSHVVETLLNRGHRVVVIDNCSTGRMLNLAHVKNHPGLRVEQADVNDTVAIAPLFKDVDWVFHLAALADIVPSIHTPMHYHRANVHGTAAVQTFFSKLRAIFGHIIK